MSGVPRDEGRVGALSEGSNVEVAVLLSSSEGASDVCHVPDRTSRTFGSSPNGRSGP